MSSSMIGRSGEHMFIDVPVGTLVKLPPVSIIEENMKEDDESKKLRLKDVNTITATRTIADLDVDGSMFLCAKGGTGGKGKSKIF